MSNQKISLENIRFETFIRSISLYPIDLTSFNIETVSTPFSGNLLFILSMEFFYSRLETVFFFLYLR